MKSVLNRRAMFAGSAAALGVIGTHGRARAMACVAASPTTIEEARS